MRYDTNSSSYHMSHMVFTFDPSRDSNYSLSCNVKLCDYGVNESATICNTVEDNCGIPRVGDAAEDVTTMTTVADLYNGELHPVAGTASGRTWPIRWSSDDQD